MEQKNKVVELQEHLKKCVELIKDLNENGVSLDIKFTNTIGGSHQSAFPARKKDASNADIKITHASRTESLMGKPKGEW